jgi:hypothetical protein
MKPWGEVSSFRGADTLFEGQQINDRHREDRHKEEKRRKITEERSKERSETRSKEIQE